MLSIEHEEYKLKFSPLRVSTMTTTVQLGVKINIPRLYETVPLLPYWNLNNGILKIQTGTSSRGVSCVNLMKQEKKIKRKSCKSIL